MAREKLIARPATIRAAIDAHLQQRKVLVRHTRVFGLKFVQAHDGQLEVLRNLLVGSW